MSNFAHKKPKDLIVGDYIEYLSSNGWRWGRIESSPEVIVGNGGVFFRTTINDYGEIFIGEVDEVLTTPTEPLGVSNRPMIPDWNTYFINMAKTVASRAKCRRRMVGAVLVDEENRVIGTGYNGFPKAGGNDNRDCLTGACPRGLLSNDELAAYSSYDAGPGLCVASHAEVQAIAYRLKDSNGARIYVTHKPCFSCTKVLYSHGVDEAYWVADGESFEKSKISDIFNEYLSTSGDAHN